MMGWNRLYLRLFMVLFISAGMILLTDSAAIVSHAAQNQADPPGVVDSFTLNSDVIMNTAITYLPLVHRSGTILCGEIAVDTIWTPNGSPYRVVCDVIVPTGVTLNIAAGVTVQFVHIDDDVIISGKLQAVGSVSDPILFQPLSGAEGGSWGRIAFMPGSSGVLDRAILEYGGSGEGMVYIASDAVQVLNSVVQHSANIGILIESASPLISASQIISNSASVSGGGLFNDAGSPIIMNNYFTGNLAGVRSLIYQGGGIYNGSGNPVIQNNTFYKNTAHYGGGLYNASGSPSIQNNTFDRNDAVDSYWDGEFFYGQGGGLNNDTGNPIILSNTFIGNFASSGGGLRNDFGSPTIQNNTFSNNSRSGLYNYSGNPTIQNNTFSGNSTSSYGGGLYNHSGSPIIRSNIVVNNTASVTGGGIYDDPSGASPTLNFNDVWNNTGGDYDNVTPGAHDISANPHLVDPANGDFHLSPGSLCIDAGDPLNYPPTDFEGDPRPQGPAPDIGADEYRSPL